MDTYQFYDMEDGRFSVRRTNPDTGESVVEWFIEGEQVTKYKELLSELCEPSPK
jgi:hypothetical protein